MAPDIITTDEILGKKAIDADGAILGNIIKLHFSKSKKQVVGMTVDMGFMKPDMYIGIEFVKQFGLDAVFLNSAPSAKFKGLKVLSAEGEEIGIVSQVKTYKRKIKEIIVSSKKAFSKEQLKIPSGEISKIGGSIILKKGFDKENSKIDDFEDINTPKP